MAKKAYEPKTLPKKSTGLISNLRTETLMSAEGTIQELQYLLDAVKQYKETIEDAINLNLEKADLVFKYSHKDPGGSYNLPGVMANTTASYDLEAIKKDNDRLKSIKEEAERSTDESDLYYRMIVQNSNDLLRRLKKISSTNAALKVYFQQLENYSEWKSK